MPEELESPVALEARDVEFPPQHISSNPDIYLGPVEAPAQPVESSDPSTTPGPKLADKEVDWTFLKATRFWAQELAAAGAILVDPGFATQPWYVSLGKFLIVSGTAFTVVKTADRVTDKATEK